MDSPQNPTIEQIGELERAGQLHLYDSPRWINIKNGETVITMNLPRQAVSFLKIDW
jgi:xylan 1,4-beta-xylosidase